MKKDKKKLYQYMQENREKLSQLDHVEKTAVLALLGEGKRLSRLLAESENRGEELDMCQAIDELIEDGRQEGLKEGRQEGLKEGKQEGIKEGKQEGLQNGLKALIETCKELGASRENTVGKVIQKFSISEEEAKKYVELYF